MGWIAAVAGLAGAGMSAYSSRQNAKDAAASARPWGVTSPFGWVDFSRGYADIRDPQEASAHATANALGGANNALDRYMGGVENQLGMQYLGGENNLANVSNDIRLQGLAGQSGLPQSFFGNGQGFQQQAGMAQGLGSQALGQAFGGYGGQGFLNAGQNLLNGQQNLTGNMMTNFQPGQAASQYTDLLRQQALPGEQQATASAMTGLFNRGRLGTSGGAMQMGQLQQSQQQADLGRQIAGQQHGLQQQLMQQQGYDQALNAEQGRQLNQYGAASQLSGTGAGLFGQAYNNAGLGMGLGQGADAFGFDRMMGLNNTNFDRQNQLYTAATNSTQDRFNRAMQMFGSNNAINQQSLADFQGLLGAYQGQNQQLLDVARLGASVGQGQSAAGVAAANMRNQGNQDLIAGFMGAAGKWADSRNGGGG